MRSALRSTNGSIVLLLGAGASLNAGVPHTARMIKEINDLLNSETSGWKNYKPVYDHLKKLYGSKYPQEDGSFHYGELNIEDLVGNLDELVSLLDGKHNLYPFFKDFIDLFQNLYGFKDIKTFRDKIEEKLTEWITPDELKLGYYRHLLTFAKENPGAGLRVFSLNYDKCVEEAFREHSDLDGIALERGFGAAEKQGCVWNARNFDDYDEKLKYIFLYKMHGSIDWDRNPKHELTRINRPNVRELIFGTRQKVKAHDPYLYYVYQFRTYTLNANLIIVCGYGFGDEHINEILHQSLQNNPEQKILICRYPEREVEKPESLERLTEEERAEVYANAANEYIVTKKLKLENASQVNIHFGSAEEFFSKMLKMSAVELIFPEDEFEKDFFATTEEVAIPVIKLSQETEEKSEPASKGLTDEETKTAF